MGQGSRLQRHLLTVAVTNDAISWWRAAIILGYWHSSPRNDYWCLVAVRRGLLESLALSLSLSLSFSLDMKDVVIDDSNNDDVTFERTRRRLQSTVGGAPKRGTKEIDTRVEEVKEREIFKIVEDSFLYLATVLEEMGFLRNLIGSLWRMLLLPGKCNIRNGIICQIAMSQMFEEDWSYKKRNSSSSSSSIESLGWKSYYIEISSSVLLIWLVWHHRFVPPIKPCSCLIHFTSTLRTRSLIAFPACYFASEIMK